MVKLIPVRTIVSDKIRVGNDFEIYLDGNKNLKIFDTNRSRLS